MVVAAAAKQRPVELKDVQNSQLDRHFSRVLLLDMQQRLGIMHHSAQQHAQQAEVFLCSAVSDQSIGQMLLNPARPVHGTSLHQSTSAAQLTGGLRT